MNTHIAPTPPVGRPGKLLSADDVADLLGVPRQYVYALARRGAIPVVRVGDRYVRFRSEALEQWLADRESPAKERY